MKNLCYQEICQSYTALYQAEVDSKEAEAQEYSELSLLYCSRIQKLERQLKEEKSKDDESYIELTFPFRPL